MDRKIAQKLRKLWKIIVYLVCFTTNTNYNHSRAACSICLLLAFKRNKLHCSQRQATQSKNLQIDLHKSNNTQKTMKTLNNYSMFINGYLQSWPPLATNANGQHQPTETLVEHIVFHHIFHLTHYIQQSQQSSFNQIYSQLLWVHSYLPMLYHLLSKRDLSFHFTHPVKVI